MFHVPVVLNPLLPLLVKPKKHLKNKIMKKLKNNATNTT